MRPIKPRLTEIFTLNGINEENLSESQGVYIASYFELRQEIAKLACANPDFMIFYRGQKLDYSDSLYRKGGSSFFPSIYRGVISEQTLRVRWYRLNIACKLFVDSLKSYHKTLPKRSYERKELELVIKKRLLQWSLLQHYEVTETPLLDVTQSLRVACSFAFLDSTEEFNYIYVFALPYNTGRISINSEHYLTNIRLISIAPSGSLRPHYQEGFLVGEDEINDTDYKNKTLDFRRRLIGKFKIPNNPGFWTYHNDIDENLKDRSLTKKELYPDLDNISDRIAEICVSIKNKLENLPKENFNYNVSSIEQFLDIWRQIEGLLRDIFGMSQSNFNFTAMRGIKLINNDELKNRLNSLRRWRNQFIHGSYNEDELNEKVFESNLIYKELLEYTGHIS